MREERAPQRYQVVGGSKMNLELMSLSVVRQTSRGKAYRLARSRKPGTSFGGDSGSASYVFSPTEETGAKNGDGTARLGD